MCSGTNRAAKARPAELDIVYLRGQERWIPRLSSFLQPPEQEPPQVGTWNRTCSKCHATHARERFNDDQTTWDTQVVEFGIACEACHGQGAEHIRRYATENEGLARHDKIVNPETAPKRESIDICGRCHSVWLADFELLKIKDYQQTGNPFEPGQKLAEDGFCRVVRGSGEHRDGELFEAWSKFGNPDGTFWGDGMIRVAGREYNGLIESPCFQQGEMTCVTCHTMHPSDGQPLEEWRDDQLKPGMRSNQACLQCHGDYADKIAEHSHHAVGSSGSQCMNCHMPHTTYGLLKTIRSHQISSPSVQDQPGNRPAECLHAVSLGPHVQLGGEIPA